jgi:hypothetical protein
MGLGASFLRDSDGTHFLPAETVKKDGVGYKNNNLKKYGMKCRAALFQLSSTVRKYEKSRDFSGGGL